MDNLSRLSDYIRNKHPRSWKGIEEARSIHPEKFSEIVNMFLGWALLEQKEQHLFSIIDDFVSYSTEVLFAQVRYEAQGHYPDKSFSDCYRELYSQKENMNDYLWGVYLSNFLWSHHVEILLFFQERFVKRISQAEKIIEIASGHGGWGIWALTQLPHSFLTGFDISGSSIDIAGNLARAAGVSDRADYVKKNVLEIKNKICADSCICCFLLEHLEQPQLLLTQISDILQSGSYAFITAAISAAQKDHIYEFRHESEIIQMCEQNNLRMIESLSARPYRILPKARFIPRSMAIIVQKN